MLLKDNILFHDMQFITKDHIIFFNKILFSSINLIMKWNVIWNYFDSDSCRNRVTIKTVSETKRYKNMSAQISLCMQRSLWER